MAKIINSKTHEEIRIEDGSSIKEACKELGVPFCCANGICGACTIDIIEGEENLSELTEEEKDRKHRLACQCKIKQGEVKFEI